MISGIYKISSKIHPDRCYIGSSKDVVNRKSTHLRCLRRGKHCNIKLQNHYDKYGEGDLDFSILAVCDGSYLVPDNGVIWVEQFFIDAYKPYFNIGTTAGSALGIKRSDETKTKISIGNKGKKRSPEQNEANRLRNIGKKRTIEAIAKRTAKMIGRAVSLETREKISASNRGKKRTDETKQKLSEIKKGVLLSDEHKRKISEGNRGRIMTEEMRAILLKANIGRVVSEETRRKIGDSSRGRVVSNETRRKQSEAHKGKGTYKKGHIPWCKGKTMPQWIIDKMVEGNKNRTFNNSDEARMNRSRAARDGWAKRKLNN